MATTTATDDGVLLRRAVCSNPADDTARLVYADWLQENGDEARAASIRAMVHRRGILFLDNARHRIADRGPGTELNHFTIVSAGRWPRGIGDAIRKTLPAPLAGQRTIIEVTGGFARSVERCPTEWFLAHAEAIFRAHPVTAVRLAGKRPYGNLGWYASGPGGTDANCIPDPILAQWKRLPDAERRWTQIAVPWMYFATVEDAHLTLSALCVAFGRTLAKLPPLPAEATA